MLIIMMENIYVGGSERSLVGVGGDSAGGRISASVAHDVPIDFQVINICRKFVIYKKNG